MNAYEYGLKYFNVKYQPNPNCVVFNDRYNIIGDEDSHTQQTYIPSPFVYEQVTLLNNKHYKSVDNPKRLNADLVDTYLLPNKYLTISKDNTLEGFPNRYFEIYSYNDEYYIKKQRGSVEELDEVTIKVKTTNTSPKFFGVPDVKLRELLENTSLSLIFFFTEDGSVLEDAYNRITNIEANEVIFFLEKESLFNPVSVVKVKSGSTIVKENRLPFAAIATLAQLFQVNIQEKHVEKVFNNHFKSKNIPENDGVTTFFYDIQNYALEVTSEFLTGLLGDPLVITGNFISETFKVNENRWKYYADDGTKNKQFSPVFSEFKTYLDSPDQPTNQSEDITSALSNLKGKLTGTLAKIPHEDLRKFLTDKLSFTFKTIDALEELYISLKKLITSKNLLIYANALFIGLYNSIIEAIGGIFTLVGHIIKLPSYLIKIDHKTIKQSVVIGRELLENAIETSIRFFSVKNLKALFNGFLELFKSLGELMLNPEALVTKLTDGINYTATKIDRIGYSIGYVIGFVIEEVLTALATGGAKTIAQTFTITTNSFSEALKTSKKAAKVVVKQPIDFIHTLVRLFKSIKQLDVPKLITQFVDWVKTLIKTAKQLAVEKFEELFSLTEKYWLQKFNLTPTSFDKNKLTLCPIKK